MNEHIKKGNAAVQSGDLEKAKSEFYLALEDPSGLTQRIAKNRLLELFPETVYASSHSTLYHRPNCPAKNIMYRSRFVEFRDWSEAERAGYLPCGQCKPPRVRPE